MLGESASVKVISFSP
jgi:hypothetical protein